jgi:hypothetical protein
MFVYIFWQHGWKTGLLAMVVSGVCFLAGNAFYFPDNLKFWAMRVPDAISPQILLNAAGPGGGGTTIPEPEASNLYRMILYFLLTFRLHFISLVSAVTVWLLLPFRFRPMSERMRAVIFLSVLLLVLYYAHVDAAFFGEFCISCILLYIGYFDFLGLMLLVIAAPLLIKEISLFRRIIIFTVLGLLILGIGFSTHEDLSSEFAKQMIERLDGTYVWGVLVHYINLPTLMLFRVTFVLLVSALVVVVGGVLLWSWYRRLNGAPAAGSRTALVALNLFLIVGLILSPTRILGAGNDFFNCEGTDVFASYRKAGAELSQVIEPGSKVYWEGRLTAIFLYLPEVQIYAPQLNHVHSYLIGGDSDLLLRAGYWNDALAQQWLKDADYIMVQGAEKVYLTDEMLESGEYVKVMSAPKAERCRWQSVITIYRRADTNAAP